MASAPDTPPADGAGPKHTAVAPLRDRRRVPKWLLEGLFIVISVVLGFAVTQYGAYRDNRELATRVLTSVRAEVEHNMALLEPMVPVHGRWAQALAADTSAGGVSRCIGASPGGGIMVAPCADAAKQSALDVFFSTRPPLPPNAQSPFPILRRSAWDAALSGGATRLIDYDLASALSEVYRMQETFTDNVERLSKGALASPLTYDPANRQAAVRMLWLTVLDIQSAESRLLGLFRQHLPAIQRAASH